MEISFAGWMFEHPWLFSILVFFCLVVIEGIMANICLVLLKIMAK